MPRMTHALDVDRAHLDLHIGDLVDKDAGRQDTADDDGLGQVKRDGGQEGDQEGNDARLEALG